VNARFVLLSKGLLVKRMDPGRSTCGTNNMHSSHVGWINDALQCLTKAMIGKKTWHHALLHLHLHLTRLANVRAYPRISRHHPLRLARNLLNACYAPHITLTSACSLLIFDKIDSSHVVWYLATAERVDVVDKRRHLPTSLSTISA